MQVRSSDNNKATISDVLLALLMSALFGVCCTFAQLLVQAEEARRKQEMEIGFAVSTVILVIF